MSAPSSNPKVTCKDEKQSIKILVRVAQDFLLATSPFLSLSPVSCTFINESATLARCRYGLCCHLHRHLLNGLLRVTCRGCRSRCVVPRAPRRNHPPLPPRGRRRPLHRPGALPPHQPGSPHDHGPTHGHAGRGGVCWTVKQQTARFLARHREGRSTVQGAALNATRCCCG